MVHLQVGRSVNGGCGEPRLLPVGSWELEIPTGQLGERRAASGPVCCRREVGDPGAQTPPFSTVPCGGRGAWERLAAGARSEDGRLSLARFLRPQSKAQVARHICVTAHGSQLEWPPCCYPRRRRQTVPTARTGNHGPLKTDELVIYEERDMCSHTLTPPPSPPSPH